MATVTVIENEFFTLWYHEKTKIVHHQYHKYMFGQPLRDCLMEGLELLKKYGASKWLSDDRNNAAMTQDDFEWSTTQWRQKAIEAGWRYWALILPKKVVGQLSMQGVIQKYYGNGPVTVELFSDPVVARQWLENQ